MHEKKCSWDIRVHCDNAAAVRNN